MLDFFNKDNHNQNYKELFDEALASLGKFSDIYTRLESLKTGPKGDPFKYEDFTPEQLEMLRGPRGYKGEQGEPGKPFTFSDFTQEQLDALKGDKGDTGIQGPPGEKGDGLQIDGVVTTVDELPTGNTKSTYLVGTTLYFRNSDNTAWVKGPDIKGVDGKAGTVVTVANGYLVLDGIQTDTKLDYSPDFTAFNNHINDNVKHITNTERTTWNSKANATHTHAISDVTNLQSALDGKATATHTHVIADVTNLQSTLDNKASTEHNHDTVYSKLGHTHAISDVTNLQSTLDGKLTKAQADSYYAPIGSSGGTTTPYNVLTYIDVVAKFGLKDTSLAENASFDNYDGIKAWANHVNNNSGYDYYVDPKVKEIRSQQYRQVDSEQNTLSGTPDDIIWTGKNFRIFANGVKFISMPTGGFQRGFDYLVGDYYRSKNCHLNLFKFVGAENFSIEGLIVDGESQKITFPSTATQQENANIKYNGKTLAETHGHMAEFTGCKFFDVKRSKFLNASVDCVNISSLMNMSTFKAKHTDFFTFDECVFSGGGRLSFAMIGGTNFEITRSEFTNAGTIKNSQGKQIFYSPAMGLDIEPHFSEIAGDNDTASKWRSDKWNGHAKIRQCLFDNNAGGGVANTSTMLTKFLIFEQNVFKPGTAGKGNYYMINSSLRGCKFIDNDFRGAMTDGNYAKIIPFGAGLVNEQTGVINGEPSNATTEFVGNSFEKCDFWTNYDGTQTYNDVNTGQYGLHRVFFERNNFLDCLIQYKNRRQFTFINNVFSWSSSESKTSQLLMRNSILKDNIFKSDKSGAITFDFGSGDQLSVIENLMAQVGKFTIASTSKATKVKTRSDENLDIYYQTPLMDYLIANGGTGGTPTPGDTTAPNAPTVNTVYANSTTITGTAEANSTVLFTGGFTGQTTANSSGSFTIVASGLVAGQTITVKVKDAAGNTSTGTTVTIQAAPVNDTTAPIIKVVYIAQDQIIVDATESGTLITTLPNATTSNSTVEYMSSDYTGFYQFPTSGAQSGTYKLQVRDSAGNLSNVVTLTNVVPGSTTMNGTQVSGNQTIDASSGGTTTPTSSNLLGAMTNTASVKEGWGQRKNLNSKFSLNWNEGHGGLTGTNAWTVGTDKVALTNLAYDGTTTGTTNERYIYFKFEGLKASTVYTFATDISYSATDDLTAFGNVVYGANATPKRISMTFKTDSTGAYGYRWEADTRYGTKADGSTLAPVPDAAFINKAALQINKTLTFDKMMLNEGNTAQTYQASV